MLFDAWSRRHDSPHFIWLWKRKKKNSKKLSGLKQNVQNMLGTWKSVLKSAFNLTRLYILWKIILLFSVCKTGTCLASFPNRQTIKKSLSMNPEPRFEIHWTTCYARSILYKHLFVFGNPWFSPAYTIDYLLCSHFNAYKIKHALCLQVWSLQICF